MKEITCKNCGAAYSEDTEYCPYCGTMNKKGAYKGFRQRVSGLIDNMLGLKQETEKSVSRMILSALIRSLIIVAVIVMAAFLIARTVNVNYYNDYDYDTKALANIEWYEANIDQLEEAYQNGDIKTLKKMYYENSAVVSRWIHYPDYVLADEYETISSYQRISVYQLQRMLYYLYQPEYYTGRGRMKTADAEKYEQFRGQVQAQLIEHGYTEEELKMIYEQCIDKDGFLDAETLEKYVKGE